MTKPQRKDRQTALPVEKINGALLNWYDEHRRVLPWRALEGTTPEPYHVWVSEIMLQQTVVTTVKPYFQKFLEKWPTVKDLAAASEHDVTDAWAGLGYYSRARNLHKTANIIATDYSGIFPSDEKELLGLPGIGPYTAAAISAIAFNQASVPVDGNIERITARLFEIDTPFPEGKRQITRRAGDLLFETNGRASDLVQAYMDLGATVCIAKSPRCGLCPLRQHCLFYTSRRDAAEIPNKSKKKAKPHLKGCVFIARLPDHSILLHRRPQKGLYGGMLCLPTTEWLKEDGVSLIWNDLERNKAVVSVENIGLITHSLTHFNLSLSVVVIDCNNKEVIRNYIGTAEEIVIAKEYKVKETVFPSLFKKAFKLYSENSSKGVRR